MRADYFCPECEYLLVTETPRRLKDRYYCPSCDKLVDTVEMIRRGFRNSVILGGQGSGSSMQVVAKGAVSSDTSPIEIPVSMSGGILFVSVYIMCDTTSPTISQTLTVDWNGLSLTGSNGNISTDCDFIRDFFRAGLSGSGTLTVATGEVTLLEYAICVAELLGVTQLDRSAENESTTFPGDTAFCLLSGVRSSPEIFMANVGTTDGTTPEGTWNTGLTELQSVLMTATNTDCSYSGQRLSQAFRIYTGPLGDVILSKSFPVSPNWVMLSESFR